VAAANERVYDVCLRDTLSRRVVVGGGAWPQEADPGLDADAIETKYVRLQSG